MFFRGYSQVVIDNDQVFTEEWAEMKAKLRTLNSMAEREMPVQMWHGYIVPRILVSKNSSKEKRESDGRAHANLKPNSKGDARKKSKGR
jgi:hypothetical protein